MLREIRSAYVLPRLTAFSYVTNGNVVTQDRGVGCASVTSAATGSGVAVWGRAFARRPVVVATASSVNIAAGGYVGGTNNTFPTATGHTFLTRNASAAADDGRCYAVVLGFDSRQDGLIGPGSTFANSVRGDFDKTVVKGFVVATASPGSITTNARNASVTYNGTGDVTLTFRNAFRHPPVAIATPVSDTCQIAMIGTCTTTQVQVSLFTYDGTPEDGTFNLIVVGDDRGVGERRPAKPAYCDQRKPVLVGWSVIYAAGVPGWDLNSGGATLTDTATGRVTFTLGEALARVPIVCVSPINNTTTRYATIAASPTASAFEVRNWTSVPALGDPTNGAGFQLIGLGFMDACEY